MNDAYCKHLFDNRHGTGQSVWDGSRTTNLLIAGKTVVVAGFAGAAAAWPPGRLGAQVIRRNGRCGPGKAVEGYRVMPVLEAPLLATFYYGYGPA